MIQNIKVILYSRYQRIRAQIKSCTHDYLYKDCVQDLSMRLLTSPSVCSSILTTYSPLDNHNTLYIANNL